MCKFEKMDNLLRFASPSGSRWSSSLRESSRRLSFMLSVLFSVVPCCLPFSVAKPNCALCIMHLKRGLEFDDGDSCAAELDMLVVEFLHARHCPQVLAD